MADIIQFKTEEELLAEEDIRLLLESVKTCEYGVFLSLHKESGQTSLQIVGPAAPNNFEILGFLQASVVTYLNNYLLVHVEIEDDNES